MTVVDDVTKTVRDAAYTAVGFGVLGFQQAQVRRRALGKQLEEQRPEIEAQVAAARSRLGDLARDLDERLDPVMVSLGQRAEPLLDGIHSRLPEPARDVWAQVRKAARDTHEQLRTKLHDEQAEAEKF